MRSTFVPTMTAVVLLSIAPAAALAQSGPMPDVSGLWIGSGNAVLSPNFERQVGELPFTDYGLERYMNFDHALNTAARCLPMGPSRTWMANFPFRIMQTPEMLIIAYEVRRTFRIVYTDDRDHPDIVFAAPEWMGHSVGRYEGDTLVFETVGINARADLDNIGHQHSDQLRLEERIRRTDSNTLDWENHHRGPDVLHRAVHGQEDLRPDGKRSRHGLHMHGERKRCGASGAWGRYRSPGLDLEVNI